jgi:hypothetical protein
MQKAGDILRGAMKGLRRPEQPLDWLAAVWPVVMGKHLASHTRPLGCREGVLEVGVDGAAWKAQLEEMAGSLRRQVNRWWGSELVRWVKLVPQPATIPAGRPGAGAGGASAKPPVPVELANEHTPFIRKGAQGRRGVEGRRRK